MDWITDRPPTKADGDKDGDVYLQVRPGAVVGKCIHWAYVSPGAPWRRTTFWKGPDGAPEPPTPTPHIVSIVRTYNDRICTIYGVDDDGRAWKPLVLHKNGEIEWTQLPALPDRE